MVLLFLLRRTTVASRAKTEAAAARLAALADRAAGGADGGWDGSTHGADDDIAKSRRAARLVREAEEFLQDNPELRGVYSAASVRTMIQRAAGEQQQQGLQVQ